MRSLTPAKLNDLLNQLRHTTDIRGKSALSVWGDATDLSGLDVPDDGMVRLSPHVMGHYGTLYAMVQASLPQQNSAIEVLVAVNEVEENCEDTNARIEAYDWGDGTLLMYAPLCNTTVEIGLAVEAMLMHVVLRNHGVKIREFS